MAGFLGTSKHYLTHATRSGNIKFSCGMSQNYGREEGEVKLFT